MSKRLKKVISVTTSVTTMLWLSSASLLMPLATTHAAVAGINDGDIMKTTTSFDVYIAKYVGNQMYKRLILSPSVFSSYQHLKWSNLKTVSQATMDQFTTSKLVRAIDDTKVYMLSSATNANLDQKNPIKQWLNMTADQFTALGYDWSSIYIINDVDRDSYTTGTDIGPSGAPSYTPTPGAAGTVTVSLAADTPSAGVAITGAAQVPFTKVNFTAGPSDVTITGVTMQRTGLAADAALSSVTLVDNQTGLIVGLSQTLNAAHQATVSDTITIPANTTKSYTLAANMPGWTGTTSGLASYAGEIAALSLVGLTTSATVVGALPITGNGQVINATLVIGTAVASLGSLDNATSTNKSVGTTGYNFSSVKITAGSAEDLTLYSIKFNQSGSAASGDLANVVVSDGTTNYATTVSSDGKYYTASFGTAGIVIGEGLSKEFTVKGDIVSGSSRTIKFDIFKNTDISVKGNTYGYYMTVTSTDSRFSSTNYPFFYGNTATIGSGSLRIDKDSTAAPAANITKGASGVVLGAYDFVVQGEPVNIGAMVLTFTQTYVGSTSDITNVTLTKADGTVISGPDSGVTGASPYGTGTVSFSGTVTFPVGTTVVLVKGNLDNSFADGDTIQTSFNTPSSKITNITGAVTGNSLSATPTTQVSANTMTVKAGALTVTVTGTPVVQTVIRGITGYTFANYLFDASASGENIRITSVTLRNAYSTVGDVTSMVLYDGTNALNTGGDVVNPSGTDNPANFAFTLDNPLIIPAGTQKTVQLKGNISGTATAGDSEAWGITAGTSEVTATGVSTGQSITVTTTTQAGQAQTIAASGQYSVALDSSTPTGNLIAANSTGNIMTVLKFRATSEPINVSKIRLALTNASSTVNDVAQVYIYDGATLLAQGVLGTGNATGGASSASSTFTLATPLQLQPNVDKIVTIKADIAPIYTTNTVATSGHQIAINYFGSTSTSENVGVGQSSGTQVANYSPTTSQTAAIIYRSVPTVSLVPLDTYTLGNGTYAIYRFNVAANSKGDIDLYKFTFKIASSSPTSGGPLTIKDLTLVDVTNSAQVTVYATTTGTQFYADLSSGLVDMILQASPGTYGTATTSRTVSAGSSRTFELRATLGGTGSGASVATDLEGDSALPAAMNAGLLSAASVNADTNNDFIWSDWSSATHTTLNGAGGDYTNGYLVSGLPSSNLAAQTLSK